MTLADAPTTWPDPPPMSTLHALLVFGGIPLLIFIAVALLVMAPSVAKGPRYSSGERWESQPERLGTLPASETSSRPNRQIGSGATATREHATDPTEERVSGDDTTGGASVTW